MAYGLELRNGSGTVLSDTGVFPRIVASGTLSYGYIGSPTVAHIYMNTTDRHCLVHSYHNRSAMYGYTYTVSTYQIGAVKWSDKFSILLLPSDSSIYTYTVYEI